MRVIPAWIEGFHTDTQYEFRLFINYHERCTVPNIHFWVWHKRVTQILEIVHSIKLDTSWYMHNFFCRHQLCLSVVSVSAIINTPNYYSSLTRREPLPPIHRLGDYNPCWSGWVNTPTDRLYLLWPSKYGWPWPCRVVSRRRLTPHYYRGQISLLQFGKFSLFTDI